MNPTKQLYEAAKICLELLGKIQVKTTGTKPVILDQEQACIIYNMRNKLSNIISEIEQSETSSRQQENDESGNQHPVICETKRYILKRAMSVKYCDETRFDYLDDDELPLIYKAMSEYASQQTADKDKMIQLQQKHIDEQDQLIYEQVTEIAELKQRIAEFERNG